GKTDGERTQFFVGTTVELVQRTALGRQFILPTGGHALIQHRITPVVHRVIGPNAHHRRYHKQYRQQESGQVTRQSQSARLVATAVEDYDVHISACSLRKENTLKIKMLEQSFIIRLHSVRLY